MIAGAEKLRSDPLPWVLIQRHAQLPRHRFASEPLAAVVAEVLGRDVGYEKRPRDMRLRFYRARGECDELVGVDLRTALIRAQRHEEEYVRVEQMPFSGIDWAELMLSGCMRELVK